MAMICRQFLTGKERGDLGPVWIAAHFPQRLEKDIVEKTNISSSVDKILVEKLPVVTYRILGFLLLGVARIYSRKVEYLLFDCKNSINEMNFFMEESKRNNIDVGGMPLLEYSSQTPEKSNLELLCVEESSSRNRRYSFVESMRAQFSSISLPENFELDAFDLEVGEDQSHDVHVKPHLEIVLSDAWENDRTRHHIFGTGCMDVFADFADHDSAYTMITNADPSNSETSAEKLRCGFSTEECLDLMVLGGTHEEIDFAIEQEPEWKNTEFMDNDVIIEVKHGNDEHANEECITGETITSEMTLVDNIMLKPSPEKCQLSVTIDVTPQSKAPVVSGEHKPGFVALRTPASKERVRTPRKRKSVYDDIIVVPNDVYKGWLADTKDLVAKRRKTPSALLACRKRRFSDLPQSFLEPIIPVKADAISDLRSFISVNEPEVLEMVEDTIEQASKVIELGSPNVHKTPEEEEAEAIAPSTPVTQSTSLRFSEIHETAKANEVGPTSLCESREKVLFPIKVLQPDEILKDEAPGSWEVNNNAANGKWSAATKSVASYLHSNFVHGKKQGENEAVNLSQILKWKTKKESARFFSELLVLKTTGYIDVKQEKAYDEIRVMQTSKLNDVFGE